MSDMKAVQLWFMKFLPTCPDELASPSGCFELAERSSRMEDWIAPAERMKSGARICSVTPACSTSAATIFRPLSSVTSRFTRLPLWRVTLGWRSTGSMRQVSPSLLAPHWHGKASQVLQRVHFAPGSPRSMASGMGKGWSPCRFRPSNTHCITGSCGTAGCGYGPERGGSVGSTPASPCTLKIRSASAYQGSRSA